MKKVFALCGSNSSTSVNQQLLDVAVNLFEQHNVDVFSVTDFDLPMYSQDIEKQSGMPDDAVKFRRFLNEYDAFVIASPEHNGMMPAVFKNLIDWGSRVTTIDDHEITGKMFGGKPALLLSASPGQNGGATNLENLAKLMPWWGAEVKATYSLGSFYAVMTAEGFQENKLAELRDLVHDFEFKIS